MTAECRLNTTLKGTHAIIRSDLEWFGPSLPHSSILALPRFFGMSSQWLAFFEAFLQAPLRFKQNPAGETRMWKRGTPIVYALSMLCGEVVLFGMDFAVNQKGSGLFLHRMHDDLWLWDADAEKCAAGWKEMNIYAELVGLKFNKSKTGSTWVGPGQPAGLPAGGIRWGLLSFGPKHGTSHPRLTGVMKALTSERQWDSMNWYGKWVMSLHGEEVAKRFGGLNIVDATLIPVGMVQLFKTSRMKLDE